MLRLFQHAPTGRWLPVVLEITTRKGTPGEAYLPELATRYGVSEKELVVVERDDLPADFETNRLVAPIPPTSVPPLSPAVVALLALVNVERAEHGRAEIAPEHLLDRALVRL